MGRSQKEATEEGGGFVWDKMVSSLGSGVVMMM